MPRDDNFPQHQPGAGFVQGRLLNDIQNAIRSGTSPGTYLSGDSHSASGLPPFVMGVIYISKADDTNCDAPDAQGRAYPPCKRDGLYMGKFKYFDPGANGVIADEVWTFDATDSEFPVDISWMPKPRPSLNVGDTIQGYWHPQRGMLIGMPETTPIQKRHCDPMFEVQGTERHQITATTSGCGIHAALYVKSQVLGVAGDFYAHIVLQKPDCESDLLTGSMWCTMELNNGDSIRMVGLLGQDVSYDFETDGYIDGWGFKLTARCKKDTVQGDFAPTPTAIGSTDSLSPIAAIAQQHNNDLVQGWPTFTLWEPTGNSGRVKFNCVAGETWIVDGLLRVAASYEDTRSAGSSSSGSSTSELSSSSSTSSTSSSTSSTSSSSSSSISSSSVSSASSSSISTSSSSESSSSVSTSSSSYSSSSSSSSHSSSSVSSSSISTSSVSSSSISTSSSSSSSVSTSSSSSSMSESTSSSSQSAGGCAGTTCTFQFTGGAWQQIAVDCIIGCNCPDAPTEDGEEDEVRELPCVPA